MANPDPPQKILNLAVAARAGQLKTIRTAVGAALEKAGCDSTVCRDVTLAVDEACQNIIRHAYGGDTDEQIQLEINIQDRRLDLRLRDFAETVNVDNIKPRDLDDVRPGGLGTHFIRELMDEVEFVATNQERGNVLRMTKKLD